MNKSFDKSKYDISNILESIGAEISFISSNHHINFSAHCLRKDLPVVVELLAEQLRTPEFSSEELSLLKKRVISFINHLFFDDMVDLLFKLFSNYV